MANNYSFQYPSSSQPSYTQQIFPQPQGNVFLINNSLEIANVPLSGGISIGLCIPENTMYIKTLQNGNPSLLAYKITPYEKQPIEQNNDLNLRLEKIEKSILELKNKEGGKVNGL